MDGTTEPVVAIIGHPIAGNPTQFALETGFDHAGIDCRVLSIDLSPTTLPDALRGMAAMRFLGIWIDPSLRDTVREFIQLAPSTTIDSLHGDFGGSPDAPWRPLHVHEAVYRRLLTRQTPMDVPPSPPASDVLLIGPDDAVRQRMADWLSPPPVRTFSKWINTISLDEIATAVITSASLDDREGLRERLPQITDHAVLVCDAGQDWQTSADSSLRAAPPGVHRWIDALEIHSLALQAVTRMWFNQKIAPEIFRDAIEEYLAM